jgi:hypothetical protein
MVIDTENPFKHPDKPSPDGEMSLYSLLEDNAITLPPCPMVLSASGGFHRYLQVPRGFRIRRAVGLWPSIDILAAGSNVILPGSRTEAGQYRALRPFEERPIPEAPRAFIKPIRKAQMAKVRSDRPLRNDAKDLPDADTSVVSRRQWCLLFRNPVFRSFWNRTAKAADTIDSAYEYHLAKACFCCGLNQQQTEFVILRWRQIHELDRDLRQLRRGIIPGACGEVSARVDHWRADRAAEADARNSAKTSNMILGYISSAGTTQTPASIAAVLPIPRERVKKAMQRMAQDGKLLRTKQGYEVANPLGTFCCITTPP